MSDVTVTPKVMGILTETGEKKINALNAQGQMINLVEMVIGDGTITELDRNATSLNHQIGSETITKKSKGVLSGGILYSPAIANKYDWNSVTELGLKDSDGDLIVWTTFNAESLDLFVNRVLMIRVPVLSSDASEDFVTQFQLQQVVDAVNDNKHNISTLQQHAETTDETLQSHKESISNLSTTIEEQGNAIGSEIEKIKKTQTAHSESLSDLLETTSLHTQALSNHANTIHEITETQANQWDAIGEASTSTAKNATSIDRINADLTEKQKEITELENNKLDKSDYPKQATENILGILKVASQLQVSKGDDDLTVVTPKKLGHELSAIKSEISNQGDQLSKPATTTSLGLVELATCDEVDNQTATNQVVTVEALNKPKLVSDLKKYTDDSLRQLKDFIFGGEPSAALDTIKEISDAFTATGDAIQAIYTTIEQKLSISVFNEYKIQINSKFDSIISSIGEKLAISAFDSYKVEMQQKLEDINSNIGNKLDKSNFEIHDMSSESAQLCDVENVIYATLPRTVFASIPRGQLKKIFSFSHSILTPLLEPRSDCEYVLHINTQYNEIGFYQTITVIEKSDIKRNVNLTFVRSGINFNDAKENQWSPMIGLVPGADIHVAEVYASNFNLIN